MEVDTSVVISDSVAQSAIGVVRISIHSTPPRPDAPQVADEQFRNRLNAARFTPFLRGRT